MGGKIVSCTTDGFITDLSGLDKDMNFGQDIICNYFRFSRYLLAKSNSLLELKTSSLGLIS